MSIRLAFPPNHNDFYSIERGACRTKARCINLVASENVLSEKVREALSSPLGLRYFIDDFPNVDELMALSSMLDTSLKELFRANFVCTAPLSGMNAMQIAIRSLTPDGGRVYILSSENGGHPSTPSILSAFGFEPAYLPYDRSRCTIQVELLGEVFKSAPPDMVYIDNSLVLFMPDISAIKHAASNFDAPVVYDASHVLGLIAGEALPNPLELGADVISGSTHKTFFGPQKGIILLSSEEFANKVDNFAQLFVSSTHSASLLGLYVATEEISIHGNDYSKQTVKNARALGYALSENGFSVSCIKQGVTDTHQVWVDVEDLEASFVQSKLASAGINCNAILIPATGRMGIRFGTAEVTRLGLREQEMQLIASLTKQVIRDRVSGLGVQNEVSELAERFSKIQFC